MKARLELRQRTVGGVPCPVPVVTLRIRDRYGLLVPLAFRVDTQADFTAIPVQTAEGEQIPFSKEGANIAVGLVGETTLYRDRIHLVIAGQEHEWPCDFVNVPGQGAEGQRRPELLPVLGRAGFLDQYAITLDSGYLIITRIGPIRRWLRRRVHEVWAGCGLIHPEKQPL